MSLIRAKDTKPEMILRRGLHARGLRYRLHVRDLPGHPDMVFPTRRTVVFVHGCFWHGHDCPLFRLPSTNAAFWEAKIERNVERDTEATVELLSLGWRVVMVWECAIRGKHRLATGELLDRVHDAISAREQQVDIRGT